MFSLKSPYGIVLIALLSAIPALAQDANFDPLNLQSGFRRAAVNGFTGGSHSFVEQFGNKDSNGNVCLGYGDTAPDHIMVLESDLPKLKLQVNSGGNDTTLVIQGPNNTLRCGDDTNAANKDAIIEGFDWSAGTYYIWTGSIEPGQRWNYRLSASE
ncbi:hypothetical protein IQ249_23485 [Lusitaniella coriacea LEGE 07157]|uniref:Peptidase S1 n=1 Tax=Lusitaniella coriacea LEGE 07157 TaxID=945747 RepID=A0A8J7E2Z4_9CYAN|nr:hypothetical protein [Lusitaniella coriacea]MBE9118856.1 hypothetical protein [Lusitaniella coriacea LEGE 07157]